GHDGALGGRGRGGGGHGAGRRGRGRARDPAEGGRGGPARHAGARRGGGGAARLLAGLLARGEDRAGGSASAPGGPGHPGALVSTKAARRGVMNYAPTAFVKGLALLQQVVAPVLQRVEERVWGVLSQLGAVEAAGGDGHDAGAVGSGAL